MKVKAIKPCFVYGILHGVGREFSLVDFGGQKASEQFSANCMVCIEDPKEEKPKKATVKKRD